MSEKKKKHPIAGVFVKKTSSKGHVYHNLVFQKKGIYYGRLQSDPDDLEALQLEIEQLVLQRKSRRKVKFDPSVLFKKRESERVVTPNTLGWLVKQYRNSANVRLVVERKTLHDKELIFESVFQDKDCEYEIKRGLFISLADIPYKDITSYHIRRIADAKLERGLPGAAEKRIRCFKELFNWAMEEGNLPPGAHAIHKNPAAGLKKTKMQVTSKARCECCKKHHTWTEEEIQLWEEFYPIGTKPRLWLDLHLYTGCRISDVERLGPPMVNRNTNCLEFVEHKNAKLNERESNTRKKQNLPILPELEESIRATPTGMKTFLVTHRGMPYSKNCLNADIRKWREAIPNFPKYCTSHGLRKAASCRMIEAGITPDLIMAVFGWKSIRDFESYGENALQARKESDVKKVIGSIGKKRKR